jgi:Putative DNA-binding domain
LPLLLLVFRVTVMWIPDTEENIEVAASNRSLSESVTFDAKKEIPPKNVDTATDVSALANTAGGVLLYGLDEDKGGCPCILNPIPLAGQRERIEQIIRTSVDEIPQFNISAIETLRDSTIGYIVVLVPPSERAPHMVIVKGERRFYGRGETGNYILSQGEVARLYERRQLVSSSISPLLEQAIATSPIPANERFAHLHIVATPLLRDDSLLAKAQKPGQSTSEMLTELVVLVRGDNTLSPSSYSPDFNPPTYGWVRHPESYVGKLSYAEPTNPRPDAHTLHLTVNSDASIYLFCGRAAELHDGEKYFLPSLVEGNTSRLLSMLGLLLQRASYYGMVDIGLAVTGLKSSVNYESRINRSRLLRYDGPDYRKTLRVSAITLAEKPQLVASQLLTPLLEALL